MQYLILEKICCNTCEVYCAPPTMSLEDVTNIVKREQLRCKRGNYPQHELYIITNDQFKEIFFKDWNAEARQYLREHSINHTITLPLPLDFKKHLK